MVVVTVIAVAVAVAVSAAGNTKLTTPSAGVAVGRGTANVMEARREETHVD